MMDAESKSLSEDMDEMFETIAELRKTIADQREDVADALTALNDLVRLASIPNCDHLAKTPGFKALVSRVRAVIAKAEGK